MTRSDKSWKDGARFDNIRSLGKLKVVIYIAFLSNMGDKLW